MKHHGLAAPLSQARDQGRGQPLSGAAAPTTTGEREGAAQIGGSESGPFMGGLPFGIPPGGGAGCVLVASAGGLSALALFVSEHGPGQEWL